VRLGPPTAVDGAVLTIVMVALTPKCDRVEAIRATAAVLVGRQAAVDTTGAGDAFAASFAAHLAAGWAVADAVEAARAAAAWAVSRPGGHESMPGRG
jgi:sugar/nucleoside kinase (ribokinase family)